MFSGVCFGVWLPCFDGFGSCGTPSIYCESEDHEDFPVNLTPVVDVSTVRYIPQLPIEGQEPRLQLNLAAARESDEPVEEPAQILDTTLLRAGLRVTLKEDAGVSSCGVRIVKGEATLLDGDVQADGALSIAELAVGETYSITVTADHGPMIEEFIGAFTCGVDDSNTVYVSLSYGSLQRPGASGIMPRNLTIGSESESNNTFDTADSIALSRTITGNLSSSGDVDYFKVTVPSSGKLDVILRVPYINATPTPLDYNFSVYKLEGTSKVLKGTTSQVLANDEYLGLGYVTSGTYYIKVFLNNPPSPCPATSGSTYYLNASFTQQKCWYSQHKATIDNVNYWNSTYLDQLIFPSNSLTKKFFVEGTPGDYMDEGCFISCYAMILRNKGKTMYGTDFRCGDYYGTMFADPYTVMLANNNKSGSEVVKDGNNYKLNGITNPVYVYSSNIGAKFGFTPPSSISLSGSEVTKADKIAQTLAVHPEGVIVGFGTSHYLVFISDRGSSYAPNSRFYVCDPGADTSAKGNNVIYSSSYNAGRGRTIANATNIYFIN